MGWLSGGEWPVLVLAGVVVLVFLLMPVVPVGGVVAVAWMVGSQRMAWAPGWAIWFRWCRCLASWRIRVVASVTVPCGMSWGWAVTQACQVSGPQRVAKKRIEKHQDTPVDKRQWCIVPL